MRFNIGDSVGILIIQDILMLKGFLFFIILMGQCFSETIRIGRGSENYPPYEWRENGKYLGIHIELVKEAAKNLNFDIKFESYPWKKSVNFLKDGFIDALMFMGKSNLRKDFAHFLPGNTLSVIKLKLFALNEKEPVHSFNGTVHSLNGTSIAVQDGYSYGDQFDRNIAIQKIVARDKRHLLDLVLRKKADYGIINYFEFAWDFKNHPKREDVFFLAPPLKTEKVYLAFSKKSDHLSKSKLFANEISKLRKSTFYTALIQKYLKLYQNKK